MTYAEVSDVAVLLARAMTEAEEAKAEALLPVADAKINLAVPSVASRVLTDSNLATLVTHVAAALVARALTTSDGVTAVEESIDDYRKVERREVAQAEGGFTLTEEEIRLLQPAEEAATTGGAFTIRPYATTSIPRQRTAADCWW